ncbi:MAG: ferritin-like domain-containing protein [Dehalococcoidia bacterium]
MALSPETLEMLRREPDADDLDLSWLENLTGKEGMRAVPGRRGLTIDEINQGSYGEIPEVTTNRTGRIRGATHRPDSPRYSNLWAEKNASWSAAAGLLYEEAVARQWSSAVDVPWAELPEIGEDLELAMSQLMTFLTQVEFIAGDVPGQYAANISPEFMEVGLFLATQIMDEARHLDVFRKRALANGVGLLQAGNGAIGLMQSQDFTEMTATLHLVGEGFVQSLFRMGEMFAQTEVDKKMFRLAAQDESRHVAFGVMHMKHVLEQEPERREEIHSYLDRQEGLLGQGSTQAGLTGGGPTGESMAILLGGGKDEIRLEEGYRKLSAIRKRQITEYMNRLEVVGLGDRRQRMAPQMRAVLEASMTNGNGHKNGSH